MTEESSEKNESEILDPENAAEETTIESVDSANNVDQLEPEPLAKPDQRRGSKLGGLIATLAFLLAASGIGGAYYLYEKEIKPALTASASAQEVQQLNSRLQRQSTELQDMGNQVEKTAEGVLELRTSVSVERTTLVLAQVEHLLTVANDRLTYMSDADTADAALRDAVERLDLINEPGLSSLRQTIISDQQRIGAYQDVDANEVLSGLATLIDDLRPLPTAVQPERVEVEIDEQSQADADTARPKSIGDVWKSFTNSITSQVKVVENDDPVSGFSTTAINRYKLELLQLRLEAMRLSLIRNDMISFNTEVVEAQTWAIENLEQSVAQPILTELLRLRQMNFDIIPDVQASLSEVRRAVAQSEAHIEAQAQESSGPEAEQFEPTVEPEISEPKAQSGTRLLVPPPADSCNSCTLPEPENLKGTAL